MSLFTPLLLLFSVMAKTFFCKPQKDKRQDVHAALPYDEHDW